MRLSTAFNPKCAFKIVMGVLGHLQEAVSVANANFESYRVHRKSSATLNLEKNRKTFFDFLSSGLGNNVSLFRLRRFGEVGAGLGSPVAGVEIGTG